MILLASDRSICIECRIYWRMICARNGWNICRPCCPSCMLPNEMVGITSWLVMSRGLFWIHHRIACGLCREMTWSQSRDLIFRANKYVHDHVESEQLLYCRQTLKWYQNKQQLFCDKHTHSTWTNDLSSRKSAASEMTYGSSRQLLSSHKSGFHRLARRTWHMPHAVPTHLIRLIWPLVTSICFLQRKTRTDSGSWSGSVFESLQEILRNIDQKELNGIFQAWVRRVQEVSRDNGDDVRW
jgi:hypothetical protein